MLEYRQRASADPGTAWRLLARPGRWHEWAPHLSGGWGLGSPEVRASALGAARVAGVIPVPARITAKRPNRSWTWQVGPWAMEHRIEPRGAGCDLVLTVDARGPLETLFAASYGRAIPLLLRRLAARAHELGREPGGGVVPPRPHGA